MRIVNPTFGSDFEMFVEDSDGYIIPCPVAFGGTKAKPLSIGNNCYRQVDCHAAEFNTGIVDNVDDWLRDFKYCIEKGNQILEEFDYSLVAGSIHHFDKKQLKSKRLRTFGCDPSVLAHQRTNHVPNSKKAGNMRTCGTHVHIGVGGRMGINEIARFIFCMDKYVGCPSVNIDPDVQRRELYGLPGEFRYNLRGGVLVIEYRSLGSNVLSSDENIKSVFNWTMEAIECFNSGYKFEKDELREIYSHMCPIQVKA